MIRRFVFLCCLLSLAFIQVKAQEQKLANLSQIHIGAGYMPVLHFTPDTLDYKPEGMIKLSLGVNYLKGYLKLNFQYASLVTASANPSCNMYDGSLSYLYFIPVYKGFALFAGGQAGLNTIHFRGDNVPADRNFETEVSGGLEAGIEKRFKNRLGVSCAYQFQRIFATPRNNVSMLNIGVTYYFHSNEKVKKWLE